MTLNDFAQIAQSVSVILAACFAIHGFESWRREHIGKRRIELAEEVLALFYQIRDAIADIRSSTGFGGEGSSRVPRDGERPEDKEALDSAFVLIERYRKHSELFARVRALRYRVMAQLGVDAAAPFEVIDTLVAKLILSAHQLARMTTRSYWERINPEEEKKRHQQLMEVYKTYYSTGDEDDPISPQVESTIAAIEKTCRALIESRGTLYSFFNARVGGR